MKTTLATLGLLLAANTAWAQEGLHSGNDLLEGCRIASDPQHYANTTITVRMAYRAGLCGGFVSMGVAHARYMEKERRSCPPDGVTTGQVLKMLVKYLDDYPQMLNGDLRGVTLIVLKNAWPCT
jgi:hypothetical protein